MQEKHLCTYNALKEFVESKGIRLLVAAVGLARANGQIEIMKKTISAAVANANAILIRINVTEVQQ